MSKLYSTMLILGLAFVSIANPSLGLGLLKAASSSQPLKDAHSNLVETALLRAIFRYRYLSLVEKRKAKPEWKSLLKANPTFEVCSFGNSGEEIWNNMSSEGMDLTRADRMATVLNKEYQKSPFVSSMEQGAIQSSLQTHMGYVQGALQKFTSHLQKPYQFNRTVREDRLILWLKDAYQYWLCADAVAKEVETQSRQERSERCCLFARTRRTASTDTQPGGRQGDIVTRSELDNPIADRALQRHRGNLDKELTQVMEAEIDATITTGALWPKSADRSPLRLLRLPRFALLVPHPDETPDLGPDHRARTRAAHHNRDRYRYSARPPGRGPPSSSSRPSQELSNRSDSFHSSSSTTVEVQP
ncbi:unnamed protein product [Amoebophrya sp. A120]|nr:unnamed protein product [Amoebophrya sp. A120]|eukprot:GSA120T00007614001.1